MPSWNDVSDAAIVRAVLPGFDGRAVAATLAANEGKVGNSEPYTTITLKDARGNETTPRYPEATPRIARYPLGNDRMAVWVVVGTSIALCDVQNAFFAVLRVRDAGGLELEATTTWDTVCNPEPKARPLSIPSSAGPVEAIVVDDGQGGDEGVSEDRVTAFVIRNGALRKLGSISLGYSVSHPFDGDAPLWDTDMKGTMHTDADAVIVDERWRFNPKNIPGAVVRETKVRRVYRLSGDTLAPTTRDTPPEPPSRSAKSRSAK